MNTIRICMYVEKYNMHPEEDCFNLAELYIICYFHSITLEEANKKYGCTFIKTLKRYKNVKVQGR